jgi:hypothetical protein
MRYDLSKLPVQSLLRVSGADLVAVSTKQAGLRGRVLARKG